MHSPCAYKSAMKPPLVAVWLALVTIGVGCFGSGDAQASSPKVPGRFHDRQLVLPEAVIRFDGGARWPEYDAQFKHVVVAGTDSDFINPGISFGIARDLEVGFAAPIRLSPDADIEDPRAHLLFQLQRDRELELGIFGELRLGLFDVWSITGGVPVFWRINREMRLDAGGFVQFLFGDASQMNWLFPAQLSFQMSNRLYLGPESGINLFGVFDDNSELAIPLGGFVGYTIGSRGAPAGDVYARLRMPDIENGFDVVEIMLGTELYWDM